MKTPDAKTMKTSHRRGQILFFLLAILAVLCLLMMACTASHAGGTGGEGKSFSDVTVTPDLTTWATLARTPRVCLLETRTREYNLPAWQRLLMSLAPWAEVGANRASVRVDTQATTLAGSIPENSQPSLRYLAPQSFALGFGGGFEFYDFSNL